MKNHSENSNHKTKVHITTLGCTKNLYDSEILMGQFQANNIPLVEKLVSMQLQNFQRKAILGHGQKLWRWIP